MGRCAAAIDIDQPETGLPIGVEQHTVFIQFIANDEFALFVWVFSGVKFIGEAQGLGCWQVSAAGQVHSAIHEDVLIEPFLPMG